MKKAALVFIFILTWIAIGVCFYLVLGKRFAQDNSTQISPNASLKTNYTNFVAAAKLVTPGVVHIKVTYDHSPEQSYGGEGYAMASGSGVIIAKNGYIATNNHVVENAANIQVILTDRREFNAKVVGRDPNTDLALIKINASDLPVVRFGNSDAVEVGEWVLAVGYPYSLNTTATAGIISAKGRNIGIIHSEANDNVDQPEHPIESFIQTDAAINPGNSGGALVNSNGELIGINAAIASLTGSYAGYAFAIPVNLARKVLDDFKKFGKVKRGVLGVNFPSPSTEDQFLKQQGIAPGTIKGVFIADIQQGSAAAAAGLQEGDIIQSIDGIKLYSSSEFSERIARHRPGDKITLAYLRDGKTSKASVTLKDAPEITQQSANAQSLKDIYKKLGARFAPLPDAIKLRMNLNSGVVVTEVYEGGFFDQIGIPAGTIIAYINGAEVSTPNDIENALMKAGNSRVQILAIAPDGSKVAFNFSFGA